MRRSGNKRQQTATWTPGRWCRHSGASCNLLAKSSRASRLLTRFQSDRPRWRGSARSVPLTHERAEGDHGQQSLDEDAEAVRQSSVVAAVRTRLVDDVRHVGDFQRSPHRQHPAVSVRVHVYGITKGGEIKGAFSPSVFHPAPLSTGDKPSNLDFR